MQLESVCSIPVEDYLVTRVAFTPDGHHILVGRRNPTLYGILSGRAILQYPFEALLGSATFSRDGCYLGCVNGSDNHPQTAGLTKVFDANTGEVLYERRTGFPVEAGCFLEDDRGTVFVWKEVVSGTGGGRHAWRSRIAGCRVPGGDEYTGPVLDINARGLAPMGGFLAAFGPESSHRRGQVEGALLEYRGFRAGVYDAAGQASVVCDLGTGAGVASFSGDGRFLVFESLSIRRRERSLHLVDLEAGAIWQLLPLGLEAVPALAFSENSALVACLTEGEDDANTLRIWDARTRRLTASVQLGVQYHALAFNARTSRIALLGGGKCDVGVLHPVAG